VGVFSREIVRSEAGRRKLKIVQVDLIREALVRRRAESEREEESNIDLSAVVANLDLESLAGGIPFRWGVFDRVIASLLINYVSAPDQLLRAIYGLLRPNGRLVVSCLREDADISMICLDGVAELRMGRGREAFGEAEGRAERSLGEFISNAARLVDLEEQGRFTFWSSNDLGRMLRSSGFRSISVVPAFGSPPQAFIAVARRSDQAGD
jgi:SAM-dependent methyltransferase